MYMKTGVPGDRRAIIYTVEKNGIILSNGEILSPYTKEYKHGRIFPQTYEKVVYPRYVSIQEYTQGADGKLFWRVLLNIDIEEWKTIGWENKREYFNIGRQAQVEEPVQEEDNLSINLEERMQDYGHQTLDLESFEHEISQPDVNYYDDGS